MKIEHEFEYDAYYTEIADEFCAHDSEYQAQAINSIGLQFKIWSKDKTRTATYIQLLEIAEGLDDDGKWFINTLHDYISGMAESGEMCNMTCKEMNEVAKAFVAGVRKGMEVEE